MTMTKTYEISRGGSMPAPFPMPERVAENAKTHAFWGGIDPDDGYRCSGCDSRMLSVSAEWPCGSPIPRIPLGLQAEREFMACIAGLASPLDTLLAEAVTEARALVRAAATEEA
jgi:hypothetical protein